MKQINETDQQTNKTTKKPTKRKQHNQQVKPRPRALKSSPSYTFSQPAP